MHGSKRYIHIWQNLSLPIAVIIIFHNANVRYQKVQILSWGWRKRRDIRFTKIKRALGSMNILKISRYYIFTVQGKINFWWWQWRTCHKIVRTHPLKAMNIQCGVRQILPVLDAACAKLVRLSYKMMTPFFQDFIYTLVFFYWKLVLLLFLVMLAGGSMDCNVDQLVDPPLWSRLKNLDKYWINWHKVVLQN